VFFLPGWGNAPDDYSLQLEDLASQGYAVAAINEVSSRAPDESLALEWAKDILFALDRFAALQAEGKSSSASRLDLASVGAFGHSHGGRSAAAACLLDNRVRACLNEDGSLDDPSLVRPYWPITGRHISGTFAMLDWFDPGFDATELRAMGTTTMAYAQARLVPTNAARTAYESATGELSASPCYRRECTILRSATFRSRRPQLN
jgi:predicted dienelactone hydrolase